MYSFSRGSLAPAGASLSPQFHSAPDLPSSGSIDAPGPSRAVRPPPQLASTLDPIDSTFQPQRQLDQVTKLTPKEKQKMVTANKKNGRSGRGGPGGRKIAKNRATKSATPAEGRSGPKLKLKVPFGPKAAEEVPSTTAVPKAPLPQDELSVEDEELPVAELTGVTTRRGRTIRAPYHADVIYGSDIDRLVEQPSSQKTGDEGEYRPDMPSSPPYQTGVKILQVQPKRKPGRPPKNAPFQPSLSKVNEEEYTPSSDTFAPSSPRSLHHRGAYLADIDSHVYQIMNALRSTSKIRVDLPALSNAADTRVEQPYSAKFLTHLYILCYDGRLWNLCDLIADTWIRAFHRLRKQGEKDARYQLWRRNTALEGRKQDMQKHARLLRKLGQKPTSGVGFTPNPPDYELSVLDPALKDDVTDFDRTLLNELYHHTDKKCGARLLWADAMALGGDKMESVLDNSTKRGHEWHADLLFNVMQTSLRMVRRKLTLKIEESTEASWCKRYHEHSKHGLPCYRELAWRNGDEDSSDEDEDEDGDDMDMEALMTAEIEKGSKRGHGDGGRMNEVEKARIDHGVIDVDAEGDSE